MSPLMTTDDVAELTGYSVKYIQKLCREDRIPHIALGREYRFEPPRVIDWLRSLEKGGERFNSSVSRNGQTHSTGR